MRFADIPGQQLVKENLLGMVHHNRLSHALLFLGKEGSGALQLAMALAQYLVCEKKATEQNDTDSCGACPSCKKAQALVHPDIHFSFPTITAKNVDKPKCSDFIAEWRNFVAQLPFGNAYDWLQSLSSENKQGNITVHECEDILRKLNLKSFESGYKVLIQWMPEYLGVAGNKLLKLIEEPPANTLFIFVAEDEARILPTLLSRTQMVKINRLETNEISDWLISHQAVPREKATLVAPLAQGNMREAIHLLHDADEDWQEMLRDWLNAILKNGPAAQVKWVDETSKLGREKQKQFLAYFIHLLSGAVHLSNLGNTDVLPEKEKDFAQRLLKLAATEQLQAMVQELDKSIYYIERNANPKMLFMALTIKIYHIIRDKSVILIH
jgi:DNA polymerase III subunit delta'